MEMDVYHKLLENGIRPSAQRLAIMNYLLTHFTHPTVDEVYKGLCNEIKTLSRTTVYNTLRMFAEKNLAQMITINEHHVCYDGCISPHKHFYCNRCAHVFDIFDDTSAELPQTMNIDGHQVLETQVYYRGICKNCLNNTAGQNSN